MPRNRMPRRTSEMSRYPLYPLLVRNYDLESVSQPMRTTRNTVMQNTGPPVWHHGPYRIDQSVARGAFATLPRSSRTRAPPGAETIVISSDESESEEADLDTSPNAANPIVISSDESESEEADLNTSPNAANSVVISSSDDEADDANHLPHPADTIVSYSSDSEQDQPSTHHHNSTRRGSESAYDPAESLPIDQRIRHYFNLGRKMEKYSELRLKRIIDNMDSSNEDYFEAIHQLHSRFPGHKQGRAEGNRRR